MSTFSCFTSNTELRNAVLEYVQPGVSSDPSSNIALRYGWPIDKWCVSGVTNFTRIFVPPEGDNVGTLFNESISSWDMSNAEILTSMFEGAFAFDQDISIWNVSNVVSMDRMFYRAFAFNRNLCLWGTLLLRNQNYSSSSLNNVSPINATDAFVDTSCDNFNDPTFDFKTGQASPFCYDCVTSVRATNGPESPPAQSPITIRLTSSPTPIQSAQICFQDRFQLELRLTEYLSDNGPDTPVALAYGWPINNWCVTNVTDFSRLFSPINNLDKATFNEDISKWDMSNAITLESMFERNTFFNQDISSWNIGLSIQSAARMFFGATSFDQNLCSWGTRMNTLANVSQMFRGTVCPSVMDPSFANEQQQLLPSPFCHLCIDASKPEGSSTSTPATETPVEQYITEVPMASPVSIAPADSMPIVPIKPTLGVPTQQPAYIATQPSSSSSRPTSQPTSPTQVPNTNVTSTDVPVGMGGGEKGSGSDTLVPVRLRIGIITLITIVTLF